ncbi:hypothetical protein K493DRAFT_277676 [Basidiobolus meristosporus CBS 931.73]|uniref:Polysaccharide lyase 14 domain-containing protein n=1 Tax=Basidiobolus meristosporus CBS 931.73 TaxID=1314790 RepID=A0A1Y1YWC9_9FUNG|nr:hypothetical protein K493DRAFT_277676 [Basidiobolus meristosporus CBS 931.73]|eukprot:ORY01865.1 hypothetical protein K493DRAFT_277676 [Basidiobolus meristosporus CBS 931.73]
MFTIKIGFLLWIAVLCTSILGQTHTLQKRGGEQWSSSGVTSLQPYKIQKISFGRNNYQFVSDPLHGKEKVLRVFYPKGSRTPSSPGKQGGLGFYAKPLSLKDEATLEYKVFFPRGFNFVKGGKLPGIYGGSPDCPNGNDKRKCFTTRFMFRTRGDGELYAYLPMNQASGYCNIKPRSVCNPSYGDSLGRGSFRFTTGKWHTLRQSIRLNKVGRQDGVLRVWVDGKLVINYRKAVFRNQPNVKNIGLIFHTFFGGSTPDYRTPVDQYSYFKDFKMFDHAM